MKHITKLTIVRAVLLLFLTIATAVAISGPMVRNKDDDETYVSYWKVKDPLSGTTNTGDINCSTLKDRLEAASALSIIACIFYFFMLIITLFDFCRGPKAMTNYIFTGLNVISWIFILVSWALMVAFYHGSWCSGFVPKDNSYKIGYGLALLIAVWTIQIPTTVVHFLSKSKAAYNGVPTTKHEPAAIEPTALPEPKAVA
eukprot:GILI01025342.1.p1 GENE.GILI01025342.1~~GILI01025342.1.p1  ORF type:complete len:200 (-),score=33.23 GILI01025342.1:45-644(-)